MSSRSLRAIPELGKIKYVVSNKGRVRLSGSDALTPRLSYEIRIGYEAATDELNGHKKTVSESETVAGQHPEKTTEMPEAKSGKPMATKTFRSTRGSLPSRVPRFINKLFG